MKQVYILVHEMYGYWDNDYNVTLKTFTDKQSAMNFLQILKDECIDEACKHEDKTLEELKQIADTGEDDYVYDFTEKSDYFRLYIEEYGFDEIYILKQDVMQFII